jgi:hypothetical protein
MFFLTFQTTYATDMHTSNIGVGIKSKINNFMGWSEHSRGTTSIANQLQRERKIVEVILTNYK